MLLEKGKGREFAGKTLDEINLRSDVYYSSESASESDNEPESRSVPERVLKRIGKKAHTKPALVTETEVNQEIEENEESNMIAGPSHTGR